MNINTDKKIKYKNSWAIKARVSNNLSLLLGPNPKGLGPIELGCPSVIDSFPGCIFVTDSRRDLGIGSYEMSWRVDGPF